jgi:hypothetical protein
MSRMRTVGWVVGVFVAGCGGGSEHMTPERSSPSPAPAAVPCPPAWSTAPTVDPAIALPEAGRVVLFHASAKGTQNYRCESAAGDAGAGEAASKLAWVLTGPEAVLSGCDGAAVGSHFADESGKPEWKANDGSFVVAKKLAATPAPAAAVPWLLLRAISSGGAGLLGGVSYVQRVNTSGGQAPDVSACTAASVGSIQKVPYGADYFFFGRPPMAAVSQ